MVGRLREQEGGDEDEYDEEEDQLSSRVHSPKPTHGDRSELQATGDTKQRDPAADVGSVEPVRAEERMSQLRPKVIWEGAEQTTGVDTPQRVLGMKLERDLVATDLALKILHHDGLLGGRHHRRR